MAALPQTESQTGGVPMPPQFGNGETASHLGPLGIQQPLSMVNRTELPTGDVPLDTPMHSQTAEATEEALGDILVVPTMRKVLSRRSDLDACGIPFGAMITPCHPAANKLPVVRKPGVRCALCKAYINPFCQVDGSTGKWVCVLCNASNTSKAEYGLGEYTKTCPELISNAVDYVLDPVVEGGYAPATDGLAPVIFAVDATLDAEDMEALKAHLLKVLDELPPAMFVGLITFGASVSVYDLTQSGKAVCDVIAGNHSLEVDAMQDLLLGLHTHVAPVHACLPALREAVESLRPAPARPGSGQRDRARCFGVAVEVGLALLQRERGGAAGVRQQYRGVGRLVTILGGPITAGPGTVPPEVIDGEEHPEYEFAASEAKAYVGLLTRAAERAEVAVDILSAGLAAVNVPLFGYLTQRTGGCLLLHDGFSEALKCNIVAALSRTTGFKGVLDVFVSKELALGQVIGPAGAMRAASAAGVSGEDLGPDIVRQQFLSNNACEMSSVENSQGFGVVFAPTGDLTCNYIYIQVVMAWSLPEGGRLERVVTHRLETTKSPTEFMRSVNPNAAGILLAKRIILQALKEGAASNKHNSQRLRAATGARLKEIGKFLGKRKETSWGLFTGSTYVYDLPQEIGPLADILYQLVRGPMLGVIAGHPDERALLQTLFLKAGYDESLLILAPRLYSFAPDNAFYRSPPVNTAMAPDHVLVLDNGTQVFVWIGRNVDAAAVAPKYTELINAISERRFPMPEVRVAAEGTGDARYIAARLVPAHRDSDTEQEAMMPSLKSLPSATREALRSNLLPSEEPSMLQWCRHYYVHPALDNSQQIFSSLAS